MKIGVIAVVGIVALAACKKGKDDPFLSLKSRDKRLQQEWVLKEMTFFDMNESNGYTTIDEVDFKDNSMVSRHTENGFYSESTGYFQMTLTIKKHGEYSYHVSDGTNSETYNLVWNWVDTDKKKTHLWLADFPYTYLNYPLIIDRLSSKELILSGDFVNDQESFKATVKVRMVFERM